MSIPTPFGYGDNALQLHNQVWVEQNEHEALSHIDHSASEKHRVSEFLPNARMPVALNREMKCRFIKTQLCGKFNLGNCPYGDRCTYAHGIGEIRKLVPQCQVVAREGHFDGTWNADRNMHKCRRFHNGGMCNYGDKCRFLHDIPKKLQEDWLKESPDTIDVANAKGHPINGSGPFECNTARNSSFHATQLNSKPVIHKTRLCNKWQLTGACRFGNICIFAHGKAELQNSGYHTAAESKNVCSRSVFPGDQVGRPSNSVIVSTVSEQASGVKCIFKWHGVGKISGIYADWIDDAPDSCG